MQNHGKKINVQQTKDMISELLSDTSVKRDVFVVLNEKTSDDEYLTRELNMGRFNFSFGELRTKKTKGKTSVYVDGRGDSGDEHDADNSAMFEGYVDDRPADVKEQEQAEYDAEETRLREEHMANSDTHDSGGDTNCILCLQARLPCYSDDEY